MAVIDISLSMYSDALDGHPERYFVDEHDHVYRVVEHATGTVIGVLKPDGKIGPFRPKPNPDAPKIVATLNAVADPATMGL